MSQPFARYHHIVALLAAAMASGDPEAKRRVLNLGGYKSRGKGRGTGIGTDYEIEWDNGRQVARWIDRSKYQPHQGKRECERRRAGGFHAVRARAAMEAKYA